MEFRSHGLSDIGCVREENQDSLLICEPIDEAVLEAKGSLVVVADGMGGLEGGELASRLVVETMERCFYSAPGAPDEALQQAVEEANRIVYERAQSLPAGSQMGSTLTAASFRERSVSIVQVGDSRAYHVRRGRIRQVTKDHSLVQELADRRQVDLPAEAWRMHRNIVTRGMGLMPVVEADLFEVDDLLPGDVFLLSSDGFHELVTSEEIVAVLGRHPGAIEAATEEFIALARERGGSDNITVALVEVREAVAASEDAGPGPPPAPDRFGWFLPLALFLSFGAGVLLTIALQRQPATERSSLEELERSITSSLRQLSVEEPDAAELRELRDHLEDLKRLLESKSERPRQPEPSSRER